MTNGVVSIMQGGEVAMKIIVGCDGYRAPLLAERIRFLNRVPTVEQAIVLAIEEGFGCPDCRVVSTPGRPFHEAFGAPDLSPESRYATTFSDPLANPRWKHRADYTEVVEL